MEEAVFELAIDANASVLLRPRQVWIVRHGLHEGRGVTAEAAVKDVAEKIVRALAAKDRLV